MKALYICIDFDGTVVDHAFPEIGAPVPGAIEWLLKLNKLGAKLILYTMRSDGQKHGDVLTQAVDYLESHGVELYGVNKNKTQHHWTDSPKVFAHHYIDDAAVGCPIRVVDGFSRPCVEWETVGAMLEYKIKEL